jgi:hypothetical protein
MLKERISDFGPIRKGRFSVAELGSDFSVQAHGADFGTHGPSQ